MVVFFLFFLLPIILFFLVTLFESIYLKRKLNCINFFEALWISFCVNIKTILIGYVYIWFLGLIYLVIWAHIGGALDGGYGLRPLGPILDLLVEWGFTLLIMFFLFRASYLATSKAMTKALEKHNANIEPNEVKKTIFRIKVELYLLITFFLLFLVSWIVIAQSQQTPACTVSRPLRGLDKEKHWVFPPATIVERYGQCFDCNDPNKVISTTKDACDKCPNRVYTGRACVLKECPSDKPVKCISWQPYRNTDGYLCRGCDELFYPIDKNELCQKCPDRFAFDRDGNCEERNPVR